MSDQGRVYWLHGLGLCTRCKTRDAYTLAGRWLCAECQTRKNAHSRETRDKAQRNARERELRAERKASGCCSYCGVPLEGAGRSCPSCAARWQRYRAAHRDRHPPDVNLPRGSNGVCWQCNKAPALPGKKLCPACYERSAALARALAGKGSERWRKEVDAFWTSRNG